VRHRAALVSLAKAHRIVTANRCSGDCRIPDHGRSRRGPPWRRCGRTDGGSSHSGNVAAEVLAREGVLDILASDYPPASLLMGAFDLARRVEGYGLPAALRTVTLHPARAAGLNDRGQIAAGLRVDLARIRMGGRASR
jgi:hypothetical protein